jgi:hypothetical protein
VQIFSASGDDLEMHSLKFKIFTLFISLALALVLGELFIRWYHPFNDFSDISIGAFPDMYDPSFGFKGIPHLKQQLILPDFSISIDNNSLGYRDKDWGKKLPDRKRIIILGDSFAWGWGVEKNQSFDRILAKDLSGYETLNMANPGYSTDQEFLVLQEIGIKFNPDIVIVEFHKTDIIDGNGSASQLSRQAKPYFEVDGDQLLLRNQPVPYNELYWKNKQAWSQWYGKFQFESKLHRMPGMDGFTESTCRQPFLKHIHLFNFINYYIHSGLKEQETRYNRIQQEENKDIAIYSKEIEVTIMIFSKMFDFCRENNARLLVLFVPSRFDDVLIPRLSEYGIPCISLKETLSHTLHPVTFRRDGHWNKYTHRLVGHLLADYIRSSAP